MKFPTFGTKNKQEKPILIVPQKEEILGNMSGVVSLADLNALAFFLSNAPKLAKEGINKCWEILAKTHNVSKHYKPTNFLDKIGALSDMYAGNDKNLKPKFPILNEKEVLKKIKISDADLFALSYCMLHDSETAKQGIELAWKEVSKKYDISDIKTL